MWNLWSHHHFIMTRTFGIIAAVALLASSLLHAVWLISPWPWRSWAEFNSAFFFDQSYRVPTSTMLAVTLLWLAAAYIVAAFAGALPRAGPRWVFRLGIWVITLVLLARGALGMVEMIPVLGDPQTPQRFRATVEMYVFVYLPIWLAIGTVTGVCAATAALRGHDNAMP